MKNYNAGGHPNTCGCYNCRLWKGNRFQLPIMPDSIKQVIFGGVGAGWGYDTETWVLKETRKLYDTVYYYERVR